MHIYSIGSLECRCELAYIGRIAWMQTWCHSKIFRGVKYILYKVMCIIFDARLKQTYMHIHVGNVINMYSVQTINKYGVHVHVLTWRANFAMLDEGVVSCERRCRIDGLTGVLCRATSGNCGFALQKPESKHEHSQVEPVSLGARNACRARSLFWDQANRVTRLGVDWRLIKTDEGLVSGEWHKKEESRGSRKTR